MSIREIPLEFKIRSRYGCGMKAEVLFQGRFLRVSQRNRWEFVDVHVAHGVVGILAETKAGEIILIEQVRQSVECPVIELPAGLAGDEGAAEPLKTAARRELEEETGYGKGRWRSLGMGATSPGLSSERVELFHATGVKKISAGEGVGGEQITVHLIPKAEVRQWLEKRRNRGALVDFRVFAALWMAGG